MMDVKTITSGGSNIAVVSSGEACIHDAQSALDFMQSVYYETGSRCIVLNKEMLSGDFFVLSTKAAGEILQKFVNYRFRLAVVGDFSGYTSKPLKDFMVECNRGRDIFFVSSEEEALVKLSAADLDRPGRLAE